jgi:hypothetical protein
VKVTIPAQNIAIQTPERVIDPIWYEKLKLIEAAISSGVIGGPGPLANNATSGFGFLPTMAGAPTGVPAAQPGFVATVYDTTNHKLWVYDTTTNTWRGVVLT